MPSVRELLVRVTSKELAEQMAFDLVRIEDERALMRRVPRPNGKPGKVRQSPEEMAAIMETLRASR